MRFRDVLARLRALTSESRDNHVLVDHDRAEAIGVGLGAGGGIVTGAAVMYAEAEQRDRDLAEAARQEAARPRRRGRRAGTPPPDAISSRDS